jgi:hypothetical protein
MVGKPTLSPAHPKPQPLLDGDNGVPDFEALAEPLRPKYDASERMELNGMRVRLEALADTRPFLRAAREFPAEFRRLSRSRHGISGTGRIETVLLKWFWRVRTKGDTSINRAADVLMAMTYQYNADMPAADLVETVLREGYGEVGKRFRSTLISPKPAPASLIEQVENALEEHAPADATPLFERVPNEAKTEIGLMLVVKRSGAMPQLYRVRRDDKLIRAALPLLL